MRNNAFSQNERQMHKTPLVFSLILPTLTVNEIGRRFGAVHIH